MKTCARRAAGFEDELKTAIEAAHLQDLVARLPDELVHRGRTRLPTIGRRETACRHPRALLRHAPYLLLDEATSSLDSQAER